MVERRTLSETERLDWLRLSRSENVGPATFLALLQRCGTATRALEMLPELARRGGRRGRAIKVCARAAAAREHADHARIGATLLALCEPGYPIALASIADPPPLLSVRGHGHLLVRDTVAIVGARNASANGRRLAQRLAADLGQHGLVIASGLARGVDASAHEGALEVGTVAVMGGGVDVVYPKENAALYEEIVARGAVVSEAPLGTVPQARHFPRRNRIISGLSRGTVVVEAAGRSGSLITARLALEQGREVFAVPGSPLDPRAAGPNNLIRQGATLVESADDVLRVLSEAGPSDLAERRHGGFEPGSGAVVEDGAIENARPIVHELLGPSPVSVDELVRQSRLTPAILVTILLELELAGRLERHPGNQVSIIEPVT